MALVIKWNRRAIHQLIKAIEYIEEDSLQNAEKVKSDILSEIAILATHPEKFPADKYKLNNDGKFKAFELYRYRISSLMCGIPSLSFYQSELGNALCAACF